MKKVKHAFVVSITYPEGVTSKEARTELKELLTQFDLLAVEKTDGQVLPTAVRVTPVSEA